MAESLLPPSRQQLVSHVQSALLRYWRSDVAAVKELPVRENSFPATVGLPNPISIPLPGWAEDKGVEGVLLVPEEAFFANKDWRTVDWWLAIFLLIEGWHERVWEFKNGPIHSYSTRLKDWNTELWKYAWVNRIALFLRAWAAHEKNETETALFGPLPQPEINITHDVDAIKKTMPIRIKQSAFNAFNAARQLVRRRPREALKKIKQAFTFLVGKDDWWNLDEVLELERNASVSSCFNFYAGKSNKNFVRWLIDPGYSLNNMNIVGFFQRLRGRDFEVGLHPGFDTWNDPEALASQRKYLESAAGQEIRSCRQHWLRFSWSRTWCSQEQAGLRQDTTLMFNDRPGFRASVAVAWHPWNTNSATPHVLTVLPSLIMDSHFYDYNILSDEARLKNIRFWLNEVRAVSGQIAVLWHPQTLTRSYGWAAGFRDLLRIIAEYSNA